MAALPTSSVFLLTLTLGLWSSVRLFSWEFPHSGHNTPPMLGDFEAQRHWVEVTSGLPPAEWYREGPKNNLTYWGLDYPPLSAFHAALIGSAARAVFRSGVVDGYMGFTAASHGGGGGDDDVEKGEGGGDFYYDNTPEAAWESIFGLINSQGVESPLVKDVMDAAVLVSDVLCYVIPALLLAGRLAAMARKNIHNTSSGNNGGSSATTPLREALTSRLGLFAALVLLPVSMVNIDYGHFQFNCVTLGLLVLGFYWVAGAEERAAAIAAAANTKALASLGDYWAPVAAAVAFFAASLFKITSLYAVPMFAFYCLGWCLFRPLSVAASEGKRRKNGAAAAANNDNNKDGNKSSGTSSSSSLALGCTEGVFPSVSGLVRSVVSMVPFAVAIAALLVATFYPFRSDIGQVLHRMFPLARGLYEDKVANVWCVVSPAFKLAAFTERLFAASIQRQVDSAVAVASSNAVASNAVVVSPQQARHAALVGKVALLCTVATALGFLPACVGLLRRMFALRRQPRGASGLSADAAGSPVTTSAAALVANTASASALYAQLNPTAVALRSLFHIALTGLVGSLSFFLFSFQVHEKSILVPCAMAVIAIATGLAANVRPIMLLLLGVFLIAAQCSLCQLAEKDKSERLWYSLWFLLNLLVFPLGHLAAEDAAVGSGQQNQQQQNGGSGEQQQLTPFWFAGSLPTLFSVVFYIFHTKICPLFLDDVYPSYPHLGILVRMSICCGAFVVVWGLGTLAVLFGADSVMFVDGEDTIKVITMGDAVHKATTPVPAAASQSTAKAQTKAKSAAQQVAPAKMGGGKTKAE